MSNLLKAIKNISLNPIKNLENFYKGRNKINNVGDALEEYIKEAFSNTFNETDKNIKDQIFNSIFSYLGNANNPPDIILKEGDAIEVKKVENKTADLALNSSYPKNKLYSSDSRITIHCRNCETKEWTEKDIIYVIGYLPKGQKQLKILWFIYGNCYAASPEIYNRIQTKITEGIQEIPDIEFVTTNELAKVKKVDPLGITDLRVRGMWHIENPIKVFRDYFSSYEDSKFTVVALMTAEKYESFPLNDRKEIENSKKINIKSIGLKSPNNPAHLLDAKLIYFSESI